jgi:Tfp pilus assembly protein PilF
MPVWGTSGDAAPVGRGDLPEEHVRQRVAVVSAKEALGHHHPTTARAMIELGDVAARDGCVDEAEIAYRRALAILQTQPSPDRATMARVLVSMGDLFIHTDRLDDAGVVVGRARTLLSERRQTTGEDEQ